LGLRQNGGKTSHRASISSEIGLNPGITPIFMGENGCILSSLWHRPCDGEDDAISTFKSNSMEDQHDQNSGFINGCRRVVRFYQCLGASAGTGSGTDRPGSSGHGSGNRPCNRSCAIDGNTKG
jgi:hypothetical protein